MIKLSDEFDDLNTALLPFLGELSDLFPDESIIYGRLPVEAVTQEGAEKEKPKRMPLFYKEPTTEYERVVPDENNGLMSFFVNVGKNRIVPDPDPSLSGRYEISQPVALIVWGKRDAISISPDSLQREILKAFATYAELTITSTTDELQAEVFKGLDYDFVNHRFLMHPFFGLRIEATLTYFQSLC